MRYLSTTLLISGALFFSSGAFAADIDANRVNQLATALAAEPVATPPADAAPEPVPVGNPCKTEGAVRADDGRCYPVSQTQQLCITCGVDSRPVTKISYIQPGRRPRAPWHPPAPHSQALQDLLISFRLGSADLTPDGQVRARELAAALKAPDTVSARVEIAGHTDSSGTGVRNAELSQQRAEAVKTFLVGQGVEPARLQAQGYGATQLLYPNAPKAAGNRRVEVRRLQ